MKPQRFLGIIMAGGKGERLLPLTDVRSKPAVPFGGMYRIIDVVLSNFLNSDICSVDVLVQCCSQSLIGRGVHIERGAQLEECVIMDNVHIGPHARLRRVIADWGSLVPAHGRMGFDPGHDSRKFHLSRSGLVVLPHPSSVQTGLLRHAS